ncbi:MAG: hypothetical protein Kow00121_30310 [Elainellaceae cyanobacterium]
MLYQMLDYAIGVSQVFWGALMAYWFVIFVANRQKRLVTPVQPEPAVPAAEVAPKEATQPDAENPIEFWQSKLDRLAHPIESVVDALRVQRAWVTQERWLLFVAEHLVGEYSSYQESIFTQKRLSAGVEPVALLTGDVTQTIEIAAVTILETEELKDDDTEIAVEVTKETLHDMTIRDLKAIAKALTGTEFKVTRYSRLSQDELVAAMTQNAERLTYLSTLDLSAVAQANRSAARTRSKPSQATVKPSARPKRPGGRSKIFQK